MNLRMRTLTLVAGLMLALAPAGAGAASTVPAISAPGRVVLDVDAGAVSENVDGGYVSSTLALPDGGALLVGTSYAGPNNILIAHVDRTGRPAGDVVRVNLAAEKFSLIQALRRPDGRLLLIGTEPAADVTAGAQMVVAQLTAAGVLDASFGTGGFASTGVVAGCGSICPVAALAPDGGIVLTGWTGKIKPLPAPGDYSALRWVVARLTPGGTLDSGFGSGGVVTFPTPGGEGMNIAVLGDGRIVSDAAVGGAAGTRSMLLARLTATGTMDPTFNGGAVVTVGFSGFPMLAEPDGSVVLAGQLPGQPTPPFTSGNGVIARYTPAGAPDPAFGSGGTVDLGARVVVEQLLPGTGGTTLATMSSVPTYKPLNGVVVRSIAANGSTTGSLTVPLPFGGGGSSFLVSHNPRPLPSILQNSFRGRQLVQRADGSYIVGGGVIVSTPTGEGAGRSIFRFAAMSLTSAFNSDPAFGGPPVIPGLTTNLPHQRGRTASTRHGIRVRIVSSGVGLARVKVKSGGKVIAQSVVPLFHTGAQTLPVELTKTGNTLLRHISRRVRVSISVSMRDLFLTPSKATAVGNLR